MKAGGLPHGARAGIVELGQDRCEIKNVAFISSTPCHVFLLLYQTELLKPILFNSVYYPKNSQPKFLPLIGIINKVRSDLKQGINEEKPPVIPTLEETIGIKTMGSKLRPCHAPTLPNPNHGKSIVVKLKHIPVYQA